MRILDGERAQDIPIEPGQNIKPLFDSRELKRWNVGESSLPPGAEIRFRTYTVWEQYRWQILGILAVLMFQAGLIAVLLFERHRRLQAEQQSYSRLVEMAQMDRALTLGVMSTSIAHELNQPLGAILNNTETAEILLRQDSARSGPDPGNPDRHPQGRRARRRDHRPASRLSQEQASLSFIASN